MGSVMLFWTSEQLPSRSMQKSGLERRNMNGDGFVSCFISCKERKSKLFLENEPKVHLAGHDKEMLRTMGEHDVENVLILEADQALGVLLDHRDYVAPGRSPHLVQIHEHHPGIQAGVRAQREQEVVVAVQSEKNR